MVERQSSWSTVAARRAPRRVQFGDFLRPPPGLRQPTSYDEFMHGPKVSNRWQPFINIVEKEQDEEEVMAVEQKDEEYEKVTVTADSGAADSVMPKKVGSHIPVKETRASKAGRNYKAANGTVIKNYGERRLEGWNEKGVKTGITMQVADVSKPLGSVSKMTKAENTVIFSKGRSIITSDPGGKIAEAAFKLCKPDSTTQLEEKNGVYSFDMWIRREQRGVEEEGNSSSNDGGSSSSYQEIGSISGSQGFTWLEDDVL